jgi:hypothetical protein
LETLVVASALEGAVDKLVSGGKLGLVNVAHELRSPLMYSEARGRRARSF